MAPAIALLLLATVALALSNEAGDSLGKQAVELDNVEKTVEKRDLDNSGLIFIPLDGFFQNPNPTCLNEGTCLRAGCGNPGNPNTIYSGPYWYYREFFPDLNITQMGHYNVTSIENATFCNGSFVGEYGNLLSEDDYKYVDEQCQLDPRFFMINGITTYLAPNATAYALRHYWNGTIWINQSNVALQAPNSTSFYLYWWTLYYVDVSPPTKFSIINKVFSQDHPMTHTPLTHDEVEALIHQQVIVAKNFTNVTCSV